jgi:hypothetical protein
MDKNISQQETRRTGVITSSPSCDGPSEEQHFPFLSLPLELRLKIYRLILPSRTHTIVTQYPYNGNYYNKSQNIPHSMQTLYPARPYLSPLSNSSPNQEINYTTYAVLNHNFRMDFPNQSICPAIMRTCKQIKEETEPILYGCETVFDFGVYADAIVPFLQDRSAAARKAVRYIMLAREIPDISSVRIDGWNGASMFFDTFSGFVVDHLWSKTCTYLKDECLGLRTVDLIVWSERGNLQDLLLPDELPDMQQSEVDPMTGDMLMQEEPVKFVDGTRLWREWEWTAGLLEVEALNNIKVTWWDFGVDEPFEGKFDRWLVLRMLADEVTRCRMVRDGRVVEGVTVVPGRSKTVETV